MASGPRRTCAACRKEAGPEEMIRWVRGDDGQVVPDLAGKAFGRGAWIHPHRNCLVKLQQSLSRSFKAPVATKTAEALRLLGQAAEHRASLLLGSARRQNLLIFGAEATKEASEAGRATLLVVATNAQAAAKLGHVQAAIGAGEAVAWSTKEELGQLAGRPEVGVLAVTDRGLARGLFGAIAMALLVREDPSVVGSPEREDF